LDILLKNAYLIDANQSFQGDIYIKEGIIKSIGVNLDIEAHEIIDCFGLTLMPSFVDTHCHFRDPGLTYKEDLYTGSLAAVKGGYTGVNLMANTKPVVSSMGIVLDVIKRAKEIGLIDVHQCVSITKNFDGKSLDHLDELTLDVKCISDDGKGIENSLVMLQALYKAKENNKLIMCHEEALELDAISTRLSENIMTIRDIELAKFSSGRLHICHVSTKEAINYIREAKKEGLNIGCEITPHHIYFTSKVNYRVNPPFREKEDIDAIIQGIIDGTVDTIGTDHAPHSFQDKEKGAPGISGIETSFSTCYTALVKTGLISMSKLSELMSRNGGRLLGFNKGELKEGYEGDIVLIDTKEKFVVDTSKFESKGKNSPLNGIELSGVVVATFKKGKNVYINPNYKRKVNYDNR